MNRIKEVLKEKGIKQIWLANKLGKSYNMVNGYVQNRQQPRLAPFEKNESTNRKTNLNLLNLQLIKLFNQT